MMDIKRVILGSTLAILAYSLWSTWQKDYPQTVASIEQHFPDSKHIADNNLLPTTSSASDALAVEETDMSSKQLIEVKTDVLKLQIDPTDGNIISADLLAYAANDKQRHEPFSLLDHQNGKRYVANTHLLTLKNNRMSTLEPNYKAEQYVYTLEPDQKQLKVVLEGKTEQGLKIQKEYILTKGSYLIDIQYHLLNDGKLPWVGYLNSQLVRDLPKEDKSSLSHIGSYTGASFSNPPHHRYQKLTFKEMAKNTLDVDVRGGWIAMQQRYFLTAFIPHSETKSRFYSRVSDGRYAIGSVSQAVKLQPNVNQTLNTKLYLGPEVADQLKAIAPGLDLTIDYGWLWFISAILFSIMKFIYSFVGNWGWSIVLVTVLIKLFFYRLSAKSYRSMANMRQLQPKLLALREKYGHDKVKISQETMALYRQEKVNPLSGCLPMLVQLPIFMALYWVLIESVELRQAPFVLWIKDLASPDPYHVLTLLMGGTMFIQQKLNPAPPDPMQAKMMMLLPVVFTVMFWNLPSGLTLYWTINNTLTILQQWYITKKFGDKS